MPKMSLCNYKEAYIFAKETITVENTVTRDVGANNTNKGLLINSNINKKYFKN